jgi:hypothetical protein
VQEELILWRERVWWCISKQERKKIIKIVCPGGHSFRHKPLKNQEYIRCCLSPQFD